MYLGMWGLLTAFNGYVAQITALNIAQFIYFYNITTF